MSKRPLATSSKSAFTKCQAPTIQDAPAEGPTIVGMVQGLERRLDRLQASIDDLLRLLTVEQQEGDYDEQDYEDQSDEL